MEWLVINMRSYVQSFGGFIYPPVPGISTGFRRACPGHGRPQPGMKKKTERRGEGSAVAAFQRIDGRRQALEAALGEDLEIPLGALASGLRSSSRALNPPVRSSLPNPVEHLSDLAFAAEPYRQVGYDLDVVVPWDALGAEGEGPAWPVSTESRVCNSSFRRASSRLVDKPLTGLSCVHGTSRRVAIAAGEATG